MKKSILTSVILLLIAGNLFSQTQESKDFVFVEGNSEIPSFYICTHEVTEEEYFSVMNDSSYKSKLPANAISWYMAAKYCNERSVKEGLTPCYKVLESGEYECDFTANGYRLPKEIEWEFAASGGNKSKGYIYSGSDSPSAVAWDERNAGGNIHPVMTKKPNELGIYDMSGNVWEFVNNWKSGYPVLRGGSFFNDGGSDCNSKITAQTQSDPNFSFKPFGFRVVRSTIIAKDKTMSAVYNLKLRAGESTDTEVKTVMQAGTSVKILELGKSEIIDNIRSNWVKVEIIEGTDKEGKKIKKKTVGWCYGGYLQ